MRAPNPAQQTNQSIDHILPGAFPYFRSTYKKGAMLALNTKAG